mmetsp:Transcript_12303/g.21593  ORF Transcript_12303/g.21593 Transcript_12303/m.21593 type:complete len:240 (+) Transcript_12303:110-829(+)
MAGPKSSNTLGAVMLRFFRSNASLVARLTKQQAVQHAKGKSLGLVLSPSSSLLFCCSVRIRFQATNVPTVPDKMSPIPPERFQPPFSLQAIPTGFLSLLLLLTLAGRMVSTAPFSTIQQVRSGSTNPSVCSSRFHSTTLGVNTTNDSFVNNDPAYCGCVNIKSASASITKGNPNSCWACLMIRAVASNTSGQRPNPGPKIKTCNFSNIPTTFSTMVAINRSFSSSLLVSLLQLSKASAR